MEDLNHPISVPQQASSLNSPVHQLERPVEASGLGEPMDVETLEEPSAIPTSSSAPAFPPMDGREGIPTITTQAVALPPPPPENNLLSSTSSTHGGVNQANGGATHSPPQGAESSTASPPSTEEPGAGASTSTTSSPEDGEEEEEEDLEDFVEAPHPSSGIALADLLTAVDSYEPTIPDSVTNYVLSQAGFQSEDPRLAKLLALATQKYISDIVNESFTICKLKGQVTNLNQQAKAKLKEKKYSLTLEDLGPVLGDNGMTVRKPPYYT